MTAVAVEKKSSDYLITVAMFSRPLYPKWFTEHNCCDNPTKTKTIWLTQGHRGNKAETLHAAHADLNFHIKWFV